MKTFACLIGIIACQGMFDGKKHRKDAQKQAIKEHKMGRKFDATSLVDSAFRGIKLEKIYL